MVFLKKLLERINNFSAGPIGRTEVVKEIGLFSFHYNVFVHESGLFERERRGILELNSHLEALLNELKGKWNTTREVEIGSIDHENGRKIAMEEVPESQRKRGVKRKKKLKAPLSTPKKYCTITYKAATPKEEGVKIKCNFCTKEFESGKALKKHCKLKHPDEIVDYGKDLDSQYRVSCKLCYGNKSKYPKDQIARHINQVHNIKKQNSKAVFKGWMSGNGATWKPVFLASHEQVPPPTMEVEVPDDMDLTYFGHILKPDEYTCHNTDDPTGFDDDSTESEESRDETHSPQPGSSKMCSADINTSPELLQSDPVQVENQTKENDSEQCKDGEKTVIGIRHTCPLEEEVGKHPSKAVSRKLFDEVNEDNILLIEDIPRVAAFSGNNIEDRYEGSEDEDSDYEHGDGEEFTAKRMSRKADRQKNRNHTQQKIELDKMEKNSRIINRFEKYINNKKMDTSQDPSKLSTLRKQKGHLFTYHDSLLSFETNKDPLFNLERLTNPLSDDFLELDDPTAVDGWMRSMAGENGKEQPSRRKDALKAHARFRDFLYEELFGADFGNDTRDILKRDLVLKKLKKISTQLKHDHVFRSLGDLEAAEKNEKSQAKKTLYPNNDHNEATCVVKWFDSKEAEEEEKRCMAIYEKGMGTNELTGKEFDKFAVWSKFTACLQDRNRQGAYYFKNIDFMRKSPKWLPKRKRNDKRTDVEIFDRLPPDWDADQAPNEGDSPSVWTISVSGKDNTLKGNQSVDVVLTRRGEEILQKYRDLKFVCLDDEKDDDCFFVNHKGKPLGPIQNVSGSLLEKLGDVCGIQNATVTSFRRAAEGKVQASSVMKKFSKQLQHHSADVGRNFYDKTGTNTRASFVYQVSEIESPQKSVDPIPEDILKRRVTRQRNDRITVLKKAKSVLEDDKFKKMMHRSKKNQILFEERVFLRQLLLDNYLPIKRNKLPGNILSTIQGGSNFW